MKAGFSKPAGRSAKNATIDRKDFDEALRRLIATPPLSKTAVSAKIKRAATPVRKSPNQQ